ncbi:MAG TPA: HutD family protein [Rhizomicrobium sp.]|nr:HutD family protein [Rhizomicrobium sp.]
MRILRAADRVAMPWKNGGGITREVMVSPERAGFDSFDWRVSIAEVREAGPFSLFPNIDRVLTILEGHMRLAFDDREVVLEAGVPFAFAGDVACHGTPLGGPVIDLNVMVRRGRSAIVAPVTSGPVDATLIVATAPARIGGTMLARFDAVVLDAPCTLQGDALAIRLRG